MPIENPARHNEMITEYLKRFNLGSEVTSTISFLSSSAIFNFEGFQTFTDEVENKIKQPEQKPINKFKFINK